MPIRRKTVKKEKKITTSKNKAIFLARSAYAKKAEGIVVLNMRKIVNFCDFFVILSGTSDRQVRAIADGVAEALGRKGLKPLHIEGKKEATWVLLDFGDVVAHIFQEETRKFYNLEHLWQDAPKISWRGKS
ncbi:MAG: ribosome silencing factor [Candidatus Omnitrophota bacterium]